MRVLPKANSPRQEKGFYAYPSKQHQNIPHGPVQIMGILASLSTGFSPAHRIVFRHRLLQFPSITLRGISPFCDTLFRTRSVCFAKATNHIPSPFPTFHLRKRISPPRSESLDFLEECDSEEINCSLVDHRPKTILIAVVSKDYQSLHAQEHFEGKFGELLGKPRELQLGPVEPSQYEPYLFYQQTRDT